VSSTQEAVIMDRSGLGQATVAFANLPARAAGCTLTCGPALGRGGRCSIDMTTGVGSSLNARLSNCQSAQD
jgi:hypothetical protein